MKKTTFMCVYVTYKNIREAKKIVNVLLTEKLIACANYSTVESTYWWKGKITTANEVVSFMKAPSQNWQTIRDRIESLHSYETPCILKIDVESNASFGEWVHSETK